MDGAIGNCKKLKILEPVKGKGSQTGALHENTRSSAKNQCVKEIRTCMRIRNPEPGNHPEKCSQKVKIRVKKPV
jgi:hypothetical protein